MLEVRYEKVSKKVTGWCGDKTQMGKLDRGRPEETVTVIDAPVPPENCSNYTFNEATQELEKIPEEIEPPYSTHIGQVTDIDPSKAKPATIKRLWAGQEFTYNCLVTQDVRDQYAEGKINIGDFVLVEFFDDDEIGKLIAIITQKIFKTW